MVQSPQHEAGLVFTPLDDHVTLVTPGAQNGALPTPLFWPGNDEPEKSLNVIALISGGKDSFYTILHCLKKGHKIIALANLYPPHDPAAEAAEQEDLNSHMYQTVGHKVIPHYANALGIPLYRRPITGKQIQKNTTYSPPEASDSEETESLVPLLQAVKRKHPEADAVCSGAIMSDYQRTRVESVAIRLNLIPLAYLWKYPVLPPSSDPNSLLRDMAAAGLDARIIRIASADLEEKFLTRRLTDPLTIAAMDRVVSRYPAESNGAGLGEGGEYETLVVDGPDSLFKAKVEIEWPEEKEYVKEGWGNIWVDVRSVTTVAKDDIRKPSQAAIRIPGLLDGKFQDALKFIHVMEDASSATGKYDTEVFFPPDRDKWEFSSPMKTMCQIVAKNIHTDIRDEMVDILNQTEKELHQRSMRKSDIMFTVILLRSMDDFKNVNPVYGEFFNKPNPPARVTFAVGDVFPDGVNLIVQYTLNYGPQSPYAKFGPRTALHVQSRSYWAPANIARYSQATAIPLSARSPEVKAVYVAGQIPLTPATMEQPSSTCTRGVYEAQTSIAMDSWREKFDLHAVLSLQHLWRIGKEMDVSWWTGVVAYLAPDDKSPWLKARLAGRAWEFLHQPDPELDSDDEGEDRDAYDEMQKNRMSFGAGEAHPTVKKLPDWSVVEEEDVRIIDLGAEPRSPLDSTAVRRPMPPFFAAEVQELPMKSDIEWHAFLGLTSGPIRVYTKSQPTVGTVYEWSVIPSETYVTLMLPWEGSGHTQMPAAVTLALCKLSSKPDRSPDFVQRTPVEQEGFWGAYASYVDFKDKGFSTAGRYGGVVPCRSLHDKDGRRLAAVMMFRCDFEVVEDA